MVARTVLAAFLIAALGGCGILGRLCRPAVVVQRVEIPVPTRGVPPAELMACRFKINVPQFVPASHPQASSALTPEGERELRAMTHRLKSCDEAWEAWATAGDGR